VRLTAKAPRGAGFVHVAVSRGCAARHFTIFTNLGPYYARLSHRGQWQITMFTFWNTTFHLGEIKAEIRPQGHILAVRTASQM